MSPDAVKSLLESTMDCSETQIVVDGSHVHVTVVSAQFEGLSPVKKQQMVYGALQEAISSGAIHAVHMQTYTPNEWSEKNA